jgi:choline dehydrogenase
MSLGASQVAMFAKSMEGLETPDIQFHFQPLSADKPGIEMHPILRRHVLGLPAPPRKPRAASHRQPLMPQDYPKIVKPNYLSATADQLCAVRAVKFARAMTRTSALSPFIVREHV